MHEAIDHSSIWRVPSIGGVEAFRASVARFAYARHSHDNYAFGPVDTGAMRFWYRGAEHVVPAGGVIALNPGEVHDGNSATEAPCRYRMLYVERSTIDELFAEDAPQIRQIVALTGPELRDPDLTGAIRDFHRLVDPDHRGPALPLAQQTALLRVLHLLFVRHGAPPLSPPRAHAERLFVARAKAYMAAHLGEPVRLDAVAASVGLSPYYFLRSFKRTTGMAPHAYLNQLRLDRARHLLRCGEAPAEVAAAVGFVDQSHLTRRFKAAFGVTPGQYARD